MASGERGWEESITRAVQGAIRSVLTDRQETSSQLSSSNATTTTTSSSTSSTANEAAESRERLEQTTLPSYRQETSSQLSSSNATDTTSSSNINQVASDQFRGIENQRCAGRPQSSIGRNDIKPLLDLKVPLAVIATRLGISRSTLYNKIKRFGLELPKFSTATKEELAARIQSIKKNHPNCGEKIVHGHLRSHGLHVQRAKVRETIRQIDPEGVEARRRRALRRREYSVPCPLYLWHVDGNHKLIRYRIVIHVGVDGYSRTIVFIDANDNNRSTTVERLFLEATGTYGYPIKVRTDLGGENVLVWRHMNSHWGTQRRSVIVGSSVHNQRVERLNRDLNVNIAQVFGPKLQELEELGLLDINNETDMFCLHYVLLPRVKKIVREFAHAHNNHSLRTEANLTPLQLLSLNSHLTQLHQSTITSDPDANGAESSSSLSVVDVPRTLCPLTDQEFYELQQQINPLLDIPLIEIYNNVLQFVGSKMIARQA